jgi:predicted RND superfamily exporter protein
MALVVFGVGHRALFITQDNSPETFFAADEGSRATYKRFERAFGADEVVLVDLRGVSHLREADLLVLARLNRELEALPGVSSTISVARTFDSGEGELPRELNRQTMADVAYEVEQIGLYRELALVRPEARAMAVMTTLAVEAGDPTSRTRIVSEIQAIADRYRQSSEAVFVAGLAPTHAAFDRLTQQSLLIFMPLVILVSVLVGLVLFRSLRVLVAMFAPALAGVLSLPVRASTL